jgi:hypothetical protein
MLDQRHLHVFMFVRAVLIHDRVDLQLLGTSRPVVRRNFQKLAVTVSEQTFINDDFR